MPDLRTCPACQAEMPADAASCPRCHPPASDERTETAAGSGFKAGAWAAPPVAEVARHFPGLELFELLGQGGMGAVYKARQPHLDRFVALKVLPPEAGADSAFAERFAREARALARLNHPNIITVYDFGRAGPLFFFVMEYVDGANLRQLLRSGTLKPADTVRCLPAVCDALQFAHDEGVVHRDIKPENVLIDRRGRVKIADFGLAKLVGRTAAGYTLTGPWQVMGTLHYMAPEQVDNPAAVDHRADIYALGVLMYETLTGQLPLGRFPPPSERAPVDARLDRVVLRALESDPVRRYQRAGDLKTDLEAAAGLTALTTAMPPPMRCDVAAVPFTVDDVYWKFGRAHGLARLEPDALAVEFRTTILKLLRLPAREQRIPLDAIQSVTIRKRWWSTGLVLRSYRLPTLGGIPGNQLGEAVLHVARKNRRLAEEFVVAATHRLTHGSLPRPVAPVSAGPGRISRAYAACRNAVEAFWHWLCAQVGRVRPIYHEIRSLVGPTRAGHPTSEAPTIAPDRRPPEPPSTVRTDADGPA